MNYLINIFCALAIFIGGLYGANKAYNWLRNEAITHLQKGLPPLEKFSRALTQK